MIGSCGWTNFSYSGHEFDLSTIKGIKENDSFKVESDAEGGISRQIGLYTYNSATKDRINFIVEGSIDTYHLIEDPNPWGTCGQT